MIHKMQLITCIVSISCLFYLCNDFNCYAESTDVTTNNSIVTTTVSSSSNSVETIKKETKKSDEEMILGLSNINITVQPKTAVYGLNALVDELLPDCPVPVRKLLTTLVITVISGGDFTLETFVGAFIDILSSNDIQVSDEMKDEISEYGATYLDEEFEQNNTDNMLSGIYTTLGFISGLLILIWIGGARI